MPIAIGQISITEVLDGSWYEHEYATSSSPTSAPTSGWALSIPSPTAGHYVFRRSRLAHADGTYGSWEAAIRITGEKGEVGASGPKGEDGSAGPQGPQGNAGANGLNFADAVMVYTDPLFCDGTNSISVYNNAGGSGVTITREAKASDNPFAEAVYHLKIVQNGTSTPGLGGFINPFVGRPNAVYVQRFVAKIPVGYTLYDASNAIGTGATHVWLTSRAGTGKYEEYVLIRRCGATGTFSSSGHVYLNGTPNVTWFLAYSTLYDFTRLGKIFSDPTLTASSNTLALSKGVLHANGEHHNIPSFAQVLAGEGKGLIVLDIREGSPLAVRFLKLGADADGQHAKIVWKDFNSDSPVTIGGASLVIGEFESYGGNIGTKALIAPTDIDLYIQSHFMDILSKVTNVDDEQFKNMAKALGIDQVFKSIVALEIVAKELRASHVRVGNGNEQSGFIFEVNNGDDSNPPVIRALHDGQPVFQIDPLTGQVSIVGKVNISEGSLAGTSMIDTPMFKTQPGKIAGTINKTFAKDLWSGIDLFTWASAVAVGEAFKTASGTLDGVAINAVTRVEDGRALVHANTSSAGVTGPDGDKIVYTYTVPEGVTHLAYSGSFSGDWTSFAIYKNGVKVFGSSSSSISGSLAVSTGDTMVFRGANSAWAVFGSKTCTWTTKWYTDVGTGTCIRLTGNVTKLIKKGYYPPSRSLSLTYGGSTWASAGANTKYISGSTYIDDPLHTALNSNFQYNCSGTVTINGTTHTVSKITVNSDMVAYQLTNGTFQYVNKFNGEGSSGSAYTSLVSSVSITGQTEAILTSSIIPITTGKDIGTSTIKFLNLYLSGTVSANTGSFSGALSCASIDTGQGAFEIGQNLRTTDQVTFKDITATGAEATRTSGVYPFLRVPGGTATGGVLVATSSWGPTICVAESGAPWREIWKYRMKTSGVMNSVLKIKNSNTSYAYGVYAQIYKNGAPYGTQ
jgi:hypothetical protein